MFMVCLWVSAYTFKWLVCPPSVHTASVTDKYLAVKGSEQWICCLTIIQCVLLCHSFPCVSAGTLSVCVNEKTADPLLHTVALQFLSTVFTEETKSQGVEVTTSNAKHATALSDIVNGPSASQLCELLLQVCGGGGHVVISLDLGTLFELKLTHWYFLTFLYTIKYVLIAKLQEWKNIDAVFRVIVWLCVLLWLLMPELWEEDLSGPFKEADSQSSDDTASLQSHSSKPCSQRYFPRPLARVGQLPVMYSLKIEMDY